MSFVSGEWDTFVVGESRGYDLSAELKSCDPTASPMLHRRNLLALILQSYLHLYYICQDVVCEAISDQPLQLVLKGDSLRAERFILSMW